MKIIKVKNYDEMSEKAFEIFKEEIESDVKEKGECVLGLATGSTPLGLYKLLRESSLDFSKVSSYNLDEYVGLTEDNNQSYHFFMKENLFKYINISKWFVPSGVAEDLDKECANYTKKVLDAHVDMQLLGLGENGHVGFNEPGTSFESTTHIVGLTESTIKANSRLFNSIDEVPTSAITMGIKEIMNAKRVVLLASGAKKADAVKALVEGDVTENVPCTCLKNHKDFILIIDEEAASKLC